VKELTACKYVQVAVSSTPCGKNRNKPNKGEKMTLATWLLLGLKGLCGGVGDGHRPLSRSSFDRVVLSPENVLAWKRKTIQKNFKRQSGLSRPSNENKLALEDLMPNSLTGPPNQKDSRLEMKQSVSSTKACDTSQRDRASSGNERWAHL